MPIDQIILDKQLVSLIKKDDHFAFDKLFHKYGPSLYLFVKSILKNESEAEEAVQDVFYKIWEKRKDLDPDLSFKSYLFTIASNTTKKIYRKKLLEDKYKQEVALELNFNQTTDLNVVEYKNILDYIDTIIGKLPSSRRQIFIFSKKDGLKNPEIAKILNISEQTVKNQLVVALKFLRSEAQKDNNEIGFLFFLLFYKI
ncbi:MAG TPA: RNA polymerase sigma-70 factor [Prolixibacteraceae bacterium]|nr:RNA polymerase sigma-70 factor [Prolixibacteraceae bacterium]